MTKEIIYLKFYDPKEQYGWGSNFYKLPVQIDGEMWGTTEQYFQAMKFRGPNASTRSIEYSNLIKKADSPAKVKMLGIQKKNTYRGKKWQLVLKKDTRLVNDLIDEYKDVKMRSDWNTARIHVMIKALLHKFQNPKLKKEITSIPDNALLIENAGARDAVWGNGADGKGLNYLGKILTVVSHILKYGDCKRMSPKLKQEVKLKILGTDL